MNSRERFFNTLAGKAVDRRLFGAMLSLYGAALTGCPLQRFFNDAQAYAQGQSAVRETIAPDFLFGPFLLAGFGEAFGSVLHYSDRYVPALLRPAITDASQISALTMPDIDAHPRLLFYRNAIREMAARHGREAVIVGIVLNPLDLPTVIMGLDAWMMTVLSDEASTRRMLQITTPFFVRLCNALFADGADVIAMPMAFFTRDITSSHLVEHIALPALRNALSQVSGPVVFHHTGSTFFDYLEELDTLPAAAGLTMDEKDALRAARGRIRKETLLFGGLDGPSLHTLTPQDIGKRCRDQLLRMRNDPRYILFATGTDVELSTPLENLAALRRAVEDDASG